MKRILALALLVFPAPAFAGEIGRAEFNHRTIILDSDKTWKYAETLAEAGSGCSPVASNVVPMEFCLAEDTWKATDLGEDFERAFESDTGIYLGLISEDIYIEAASMKQAVVENAEAGAGPGGLKNLVQEDTTIDGRSWLHSSFSFRYGSIEIGMENFMYSDQRLGTVQIAIWGAAGADNRLREAAETVSATLRIAEHAENGQ